MSDDASEFFDVRMRGFQSRADVADVMTWIDRLPNAMSAERVPLGALYGRVLAESIRSPIDVPAFRRAAMDGWALHGNDTFGANEQGDIALRIVGAAFPGRPFEGRVKQGQAIRIMTGAPVPDDCDAVLRAEDGREDAAGESTIVRVRAPVAPKKNVGRVGDDIHQGALVLEAGRRLRPQDVGLLSSMGFYDARVLRVPRVELIMTGDELLPSGAAPEGHLIVDSNGRTLEGLLRRDGAEVVDLCVLPDRADLLRDRLVRTEADIVMVSGGSSVGLEDHAPRILSELGTLVFHGIQMRPAAPTGMGTIRDRVVFLLPGNPVSCLSAYDVLAGRLVRRLAGKPPDLPYRIETRPLAGKLTSALGRVDYIRVHVREGMVHPFMARGASLLSSTTTTDGFVVVPRDAEGYPAGHPVDVFLYDQSY